MRAVFQKRRGIISIRWRRSSFVRLDQSNQKLSK